jgi:RimJ/RimL family protein N-acetyltransferase
LYTYLTQARLGLPYTALTELPETAWPSQTAELIARQRTVFDGRTGERLQAAVVELETIYALGIRRAAATDTTQYFAWVNETLVRAQALRPEPIAWADHARWFAARIVDVNAYLYVLTAPDAPNELIGQVRIEFDTNGRGLIDYSLAPAWRSRGLGAALLRRALGRLRLDRPDAWHLRAVVRETNLASARVFDKLGFESQIPQIIAGYRCLVYFADAPAPFGE